MSVNQNVEKRSCLLASLAGALTGSGYSLPAGVTWKANKLREREREIEREREGERERGREGEPA